jgi:hypothetical protein
MLIAEVKEGRAIVNEAATDPGEPGVTQPVREEEHLAR